MKKNQLILNLCVAALVSSAAVSATGQELVTNGGFESGTFSGFQNQDNSDPDISVVGQLAEFAFQGDNYAALGTVGNVFSSLSQVLTTVIGETYTLSFALANDSGIAPNSFEVRFGGNSLETFTNFALFDYTTFQYQVVATSTQSTLEFVYKHEDDFFRLDSVSVVPEWSSTGYLALGTVGGLVVYVRNRRSRRTALV